MSQVSKVLPCDSAVQGVRVLLAHKDTPQELNMPNREMVMVLYGKVSVAKVQRAIDSIQSIAVA